MVHQPPSPPLPLLHSRARAALAHHHLPTSRPSSRARARLSAFPSCRFSTSTEVVPFPQGHDSRFRRFTASRFMELRGPRGCGCRRDGEVRRTFYGEVMGTRERGFRGGREETRTSPRNLTAGMLPATRRKSDALL